MSELKPYVPEGFDDFWRLNVSEADAAPLDYELARDVSHPEPTQTVQTNPGTTSAVHEIRTFDFRGVAGEKLHGWIALPERNEFRAPGFLWIAPYGRESVMPNQYGTRPGFASLSFNFFGHDAFHQEKYNPANGYFAEGALEKETWVFGRMFQNAVIATRILADLPQVDSEKLGSMGMSQGGGISIWLGAWCERIKAVCADMPFLGGMHETLMKNVYRYPLKELMDFMASIPSGQEKVLRTLSYFDTLNQATRCTKPTLVSIGLRDPAVKPIQARAIFEALPGQKELHEYDCGHDWHPDMVANNQRWLVDHLGM